MPISGSVVLASEAIPAATSPAPYKIFTVANPTGVQLYGFIITNTANQPVNYTIFQDNYNNVIASGTIAALAGPTTLLLQGNLANGEMILATASMGGVVQLEVDGILNVQDPVTQMMQNVIFMLAQLGLDIPPQGAMNVGSFSF